MLMHRNCVAYLRLCFVSVINFVMDIRLRKRQVKLTFELEMTRFFPAYTQ